MQQIHSKYITNTPFRITTETVKNSPGTWDSTKVSIYRNSEYSLQVDVYREGTLIGEYIRNYPPMANETFCPFLIGDQWYALYSAEYTATRVMKLHEDRIEDWCGEPGSANGFCPLEFYVPRVVHTCTSISINGEESRFDSYKSDCDYTVSDIKESIDLPGFVSFNYCNFGFISGCEWGDDSSGKLRYIDLSKVPEKQLIISEKFGYWELPPGKLKDCIHMRSWTPDINYIELSKIELFDLDKK